MESISATLTGAFIIFAGGVTYCCEDFSMTGGMWYGIDETYVKSCPQVNCTSPAEGTYDILG